MAHIVRIKRRATSGAPTSLANAELAFNESSETLYYGKGTGGPGGSAGSIIAIGGIGAFVGLTGNQSIAGTKTFTGVVVVPTPTSTNHATTKTYVDSNFLSSATNSTQAGYFGDIYLYDDSTPSHYLQITNSANLTAARILSINVNDADRTVSLSGNLTVSSAATISGTNTGDQTITLTGDVTGTGTGSFAATIANDAVTTAKIANTAVTFAKLPKGQPNRVLGTPNGLGTQDFQEIVLSSVAGNVIVGGLDNTDTSLTLAPSGVTASTYRSVTVNSQGIITAGTNPTTFSGYGISETSAGLLAVISDETGSGVLVFGTSPSFTTSVTTGSASFDVFNTTATTVNAFGAATTVQIGATTGITTVRNDLSVTKTITATEGFRVGSSAINAQTIAYSLQASDNGKIVTVNSASAVNVTVGTAVGAAGFSCTIIQLGAGQVTIAANGTTLNSYAGLKIQGQHGAATIFCYATNTFNVAGNLVS